MKDSGSNCRAASHGEDITTMATVSGRMADHTKNGARGRCWPLLTGERAHYELAAGGDYRSLIHAMEASAPPTVSCRNSYGTRTICPRRICIAVDRAAPPCRWSGRIPSTFACSLLSR